MKKDLIKDVIYKELKVIRDERGFVCEVLRSDWSDIFKKFGQAYITCCNPRWVKGWHYHKIQTDLFCCIRGEVRVVLVDNRPNSETFNKINEFIMREDKPEILLIPPFVLHGFECISETACWILNIPSEVYKYEGPDEYRLPLNSPEVNYAPWKTKRGY